MDEFVPTRVALRLTPAHLADRFDGDVSYHTTVKSMA